MALPHAETPLPNPGVARLISEARSADGVLTVLAIGAATDVASAILLAPDIAGRLDIVAMGFQDADRGGDEWNVKNDPHAWRVLLGSDARLTVGPASVCIEHLCLTPAEARAILPHNGVGDYLGGLLKEWIAANGEAAHSITGKVDAWPVWDEIAVAHLLGLTECVRSPRPILREDLSFGYPHGDLTMDWIASVDVVALWHDLASRCCGI
jgi:inosine-uridine nucleoside N-ribohydrolase